MDQRQATLRRCVRTASIEWDEGRVRLQMYPVPLNQSVFANCDTDEVTIAW